VFEIQQAVKHVSGGGSSALRRNHMDLHPSEPKKSKYCFGA
jgi:hypothetical protein